MRLMNLDLKRNLFQDWHILLAILGINGDRAHKPAGGHPRPQPGQGRPAPPAGGAAAAGPPPGGGHNAPHATGRKRAESEQKASRMVPRSPFLGTE
jgi:hypothetical protein